MTLRMLCGQLSDEVLAAEYAHDQSFGARRTPAIAPLLDIAPWIDTYLPASLAGYLYRDAAEAYYLANCKIWNAIRDDVKAQLVRASSSGLQTADFPL